MLFLWMRLAKKIGARYELELGKKNPKADPDDLGDVSKTWIYVIGVNMIYPLIIEHSHGKSPFL